LARNRYLTREVARLRGGGIEASQADLLAALDALPIAVACVDARGRHVFVNRCLAARCGIAPEAANGRTAVELLGAAGHRVAELDRRVMESGTPSTDIEIEHADAAGGRRIWLAGKAPVRAPDGRVSYVLTAAIDITKRKLDERAAAAARERLEQLSAAKTDVMARLGHELRTPLNAIIGFAELLGHQIHGALGSPRYLEYARDIGQSGRHLLELINNLLDFAKIESGKMTLHSEAIELAEIVETPMQMLRDQAERAGLALALDLPEAVIRLEADRLALRQVLLNLLANAIKFTPRGGTITVGAAIGRDGGLSLWVRDSGIGMRPEDIPVALRPYEQLAQGGAPRRPGTGLGLPIAQNLMAMHGGELAIDSRPGEGTTVRLRFPPERVVSVQMLLTLPGRGGRPAARALR
jgi:PAS domain S-box-containing protein